jgi:8-oxo-dGTP diphosphatase
MVTEPPVIAAAVIVDRERVLLVRRRIVEAGVAWQFPGGAIEPGETAEEAAVRETYEEVGVHVVAAQVLGERVHVATGRRLVYVACDSPVGTARVVDVVELAEVRWCDRADLTELMPFPLFGPVRVHLGLS